MILWQFALKSSIVPNVVVKGNLDFKSIEPYSSAEFAQGLIRIRELPTLPLIFKALYPNRRFEEFIQVLQTIESIKDFQGTIISDAVDTILHSTSKGLTLSGLTQHDPNKKCLYISNHRDIICDPAFLTNSLYIRGYGTPKICLGDNLLTHPLVIDLVKMNKGVTVQRNLPPRELLKFSFALSTYIYEQINQNIDSVWIAQREGRAKDGNDKTQSGILKMLTMAGEGEFFQRIKGLNIIPVSISYEYDPCDAL
ncbi:MAG: 1-acyl-sn-glycerol-3-phosphate acyltransferase, partial [Bdellovibrionia bacterium]